MENSFIFNNSTLWVLVTFGIPLATLTLIFLLAKQRDKQTKDDFKSSSDNRQSALDKSRLKQLDAAIKNAKKSPAPYLERGTFYLEQGAAEQALSDFSAALALQKTAEAYNFHAWACRDLGRLETSIASYTAAISLEEDNSEHYADRAYTYLQMQRFQEALADAEKAIELDSRHPWPYALRGAAAAGLGLTAEAEEAARLLERAQADYRRAQEDMDPQNLAAAISKLRQRLGL